MRVARYAQRGAFGIAALLLFASSAGCGGRSVLSRSNQGDGGGLAAGGSAGAGAGAPGGASGSGGPTSGGAPSLAGQGGVSEGGVGGAGSGAGGAGSGAGGAGSGAGGAGAGGGCACEDSKLCCGGECIDPRNDRANCGACRHDCGGGECIGGACQPLVLWNRPDEHRLVDLDVDDEYVYFSEVYVPGSVSIPNAGAIWRVPQAGGPAVQIVGSESVELSAEIAVGGGFVYWLVGRKLRRVSTEGGTAEDFAEAGPNAYDLWAGENELYWTNQFTNASAVLVAPFDTGAPSRLVSDIELALDVTADADSVYFADGWGEIVGKVPIGGGAVTALAESQYSVGSLSVFGDHAYFARTDNGGSVHRTSTDGGDPPSLLFRSFGGVAEIAVDASGIYVATGSSLLRSTLDGEHIVPLPGDAQTLALTDSAVYFAATGGVVKLAK